MNNLTVVKKKRSMLCPKNKRSQLRNFKAIARIPTIIQKLHVLKRELQYWYTHTVCVSFKYRSVLISAGRPARGKSPYVITHLGTNLGTSVLTPWKPRSLKRSCPKFSLCDLSLKRQLLLKSLQVKQRSIIGHFCACRGERSGGSWTSYFLTRLQGKERSILGYFCAGWGETRPGENRWRGWMPRTIFSHSIKSTAPKITSRRIDTNCVFPPS